jgi:ACR3 family arsenite efflux pump ArsB
MRRATAVGRIARSTGSDVAIGIAVLIVVVVDNAAVTGVGTVTVDVTVAVDLIAFAVRRTQFCVRCLRGRLRGRGKVVVLRNRWIVHQGAG